MSRPVARRIVVIVVNALWVTTLESFHLLSHVPALALAVRTAPTKKRVVFSALFLNRIFEALCGL